MQRLPILLVFLLSTVVVIGVTLHLGTAFSMFDAHPWLDIPLHFLGGLMVALAFLLSFIYMGQLPVRYRSVVPAMSLVLLIGLLWELFEIQAGFPLYEPGFREDMMLDLVMDLIGGFVGYGIGVRVHTLEFEIMQEEHAA